MATSDPSRRWISGDVRSQPALDLGDALGREALLAPVVDRAKRDAVVVDPRERVAQ